MPLIQIELAVNAPIELVFDLSRDIDMHKRSTAATKEEAIAGKTTGLMELGDEVTWRAKHFGVYQTLSSKMVELEKPHYCVDEMTKGVFKSFRHEHRFETKGKQAIISDSFNYVSPLGFLGRIADNVFLKRYMTQFLITRNNIIKKEAELKTITDLNKLL